MILIRKDAEVVKEEKLPKSKTLIINKKINAVKGEKNAK